MDTTEIIDLQTSNPDVLVSEREVTRHHYDLDEQLYAIQYKAVLANAEHKLTVEVTIDSDTHARLTDAYASRASFAALSDNELLDCVIGQVSNDTFMDGCLNWMLHINCAIGER